MIKHKIEEFLEDWGCKFDTDNFNVKRGIIDNSRKVVGHKVRKDKYYYDFFKDEFVEFLDKLRIKYTFINSWGGLEMNDKLKKWKQYDFYVLTYIDENNELVSMPIHIKDWT